VEEGVTRQQDLRMRLYSVKEELGRTQNLVHELRYGSDTYATELLARLRMGEDVARLVDAGKQHSTRYECSTRVNESNLTCKEVDWS